MNKYEEIAQLYLRLNGFFSVTNFVLHPRQVRTDIDIYGVRFPHQKEVLHGKVLKPDHTLALSNTKVDVVLAEVKSGSPTLNRTWQDEKRMTYALQFLGLFSTTSDLTDAARSLAQSRIFEDSKMVIRVMLFSDHRLVLHDRLNRRLDSVLEFIASRFRKYKPLKTYHPMWSGLAQQIFQFVGTHSEPLTVDVIERLSPND